MKIIRKQKNYKIITMIASFLISALIVLNLTGILNFDWRWMLLLAGVVGMTITALWLFINVLLTFDIW